MWQHIADTLVSDEVTVLLPASTCFAQSGNVHFFLVDQREILMAFLDEVALATEAHKIAHAKFTEILKDTLSGLPHPNGVHS